MSERRCERLRLEIAQREAFIRPVQHIDRSRRANLIRSPDTLRFALAEVRRRQSDVERRIFHARRVLVREAIAVFGLDEHEIARLALPSPDAFRRECMQMSLGFFAYLVRVHQCFHQRSSASCHPPPVSDHILPFHRSPVHSDLPYVSPYRPTHTSRKCSVRPNHEIPRQTRTMDVIEAKRIQARSIPHGLRTTVLLCRLSRMESRRRRHRRPRRKC